MNRFTRLCHVRGILILICLSGGAVVAQEGRALTPDDLFKLEELGDVAIAPDGHSIAFVRRRSSSSKQAYMDNESADIWLASLDGMGTSTNLTHGEVDGSGYWMPTWSPDGARIAMLSTKGGDNVRLWVWEKATGLLRKVSERGLSTSWPDYSWFSWIDNLRLAAVLLPEDEQGLEEMRRRVGPEIAIQEWQKSWVGREATASVLESGVKTDLKSRRRQQLVLLDLTGKEQFLTSAMSVIKSVQFSPDGQHVAFLNQIGIVHPNPAKLLEYGSSRLSGENGREYRYQLEIVATTSGVSVDKVRDDAFVVPGSFRWSRDGSTYAFIGVRAGEKEGPFRVFRGRIDGAIEEVLLTGGEPYTLAWAEGNRLLISAEREVSGVKRKDWWLVSPSKVPRNLSERLKMVPADLLPDQVGKTFIGSANGDVWRINIDSGEWRNLTETFEPKITGIAWPNARVSRGEGFSRIVFSVQRGALTDYYRMDFASGSIMRLVRPSGLAQLVTYLPKADMALFLAAERSGTYLTLVQDKDCRLLAETNAFLGEIAEGERRMIEYRSLEGKDLKGWIVLPANYQAGRHYPLVTWVYAGITYGDEPPRYTNLNNRESIWQMQLLAARGYAVLLPSMPLPAYPSKYASDPYMELPKGVLAAVDKVIELGIADQNRLAIMGHSYGAYSTFGLVTQTSRFQAAIALAGPSDLISTYGVFPAKNRYEPFSHEAHPLQVWAETGQGRMANPPWKDWARYLRNSPIFYIERVQTPLLIVHGDLDDVNIQQAEEFFTGLYRQGKRARFIRYWGEGHTIESPANIRNMWQHIYAWLDEFCDISRDASGNLVFDGDHVKSRNGTPPLKPEDFARFNELELQSRSTQKK